MRPYQYKYRGYLNIHTIYFSAFLLLHTSQKRLKPMPTILKGGHTMKKKPHMTSIVLLVLLAVVNSAYAQDKSEYHIGNGDILEIVTWKEPDFSREDILVRLDGKISFPLLNDVQASGKTPIELKKSIEAGLKEYVAVPNVTVTVTNAASQRFYILGEVANTGEYPLSQEPISTAGIRTGRWIHRMGHQRKRLFCLDRKTVRKG